MATNTSPNGNPNAAHSGRGGNAFLYFVVGALIVAVGVLGFFFLQDRQSGSEASIERSADAIGDAADDISDAVRDAGRDLPPPTTPVPAPPTTPAIPPG